MTANPNIADELMRQARAEARFWREACIRQAELAREVAHYSGANAKEVMAFTLGRIAEGPTRPAQGVMAKELEGQA